MYFTYRWMISYRVKWVYIDHSNKDIICIVYYSSPGFSFTYMPVSIIEQYILKIILFSKIVESSPVHTI